MLTDLLAEGNATALRKPVFAISFGNGGSSGGLGGLAASLGSLVGGSDDPWLESQTRVAEKRYQDFGGQITVIIQDGQAHYPLAPQDPQPAVEFIVKSFAAREGEQQ